MHQFEPRNPIVQLCMTGMKMAEDGNAEAAAEAYSQAWQSAVSTYEKFLAAYFMARSQTEGSSRIAWLNTALKCALETEDLGAKSALPSIYRALAEAHETCGTPDQGPFFHGTRADLKVGDLLTPGGLSNYQPELVMNHIYFTALISGAGLAAALAKGESRERVYLVEPTGPFENDPNVTDKKFPGNLTRSYRSLAPLKVIGEVEDWAKQTPESLRAWRDKLAENQGEIIN